MLKELLIRAQIETLCYLVAESLAEFYPRVMWTTELVSHELVYIFT